MSIIDRSIDWVYDQCPASSRLWMQGFSGSKLNPMRLRPEDVDVRDVAHALSHTCRYSGHCDWHYSVAQHSVLVSRFCDPEDALWGLLHDASEYILGDVPTPLKRTWLYRPYRVLEARVMRVVCDRFGLPHQEPRSVKRADRALLAAEVPVLMQPVHPEWFSWIQGIEPAGCEITEMSPRQARTLFLDRFNELSEKRVA